MANESTTGGPLTATLGEQLAGKGHLGAVQEAGKGAAPGTAGEGTLRAGAEVERREHATETSRSHAGAQRGRRGAARVPWGAILAAGAGWVLAKSIAHGLRRPARRIARGLRRR